MEDLLPIIINAQQGDEEAMMQLICQFHNLLAKLSKDYNGILNEDCYQILVERFIKAVYSFDTKRI